MMAGRLIATATTFKGAATGSSSVAVQPAPVMARSSKVVGLAAAMTAPMPLWPRGFSSSAAKLSAESKQGAQRRVPHITLYIGTHCSLCDVVKETLKEAAKSSETPKFEVSTYNIHDDSLPDVQRWRRAYQYDIPVIHLDGKEIARHRLDKAVLLAKLKETMG